MIIEIYSNKLNILFDIFGSDKIENGNQITIPGNATVKFINFNSPKSIVSEIPISLELLIAFGSGAVSSLIANWIYDKFKGKAKTIKINRKVVNLNKGKIKSVVEESIKMEL